MDGHFVCEFCNKAYTSISNLNYHKKNAKFCIEIQQEQKSTFSCEHCKKEFTNERYLKQHLQRCKSKKENIVQQTNEKLNKLEKESSETIHKLEKESSETIHKLEKEILELKLTLNFKDEIIKKLEKEISEFKKLEKRPNKTTIVNNNIDNSNTHNYQIQFNQLFENIHKLTSHAMNFRIPNISIAEIDKYDINNFESSFSKSLSNIFKDYTFCSNNETKEFVIKNENGEVNKMHIDEFVKYGLSLSIEGINKFMRKLEDRYMNRLDTNKITEEEFITVDESISNVLDFMKKLDKNFNSVTTNDENYPFKTLAQDTLKKCEHLITNIK
jgi:hypothetical protein